MNNWPPEALQEQEQTEIQREWISVLLRERDNDLKQKKESLIEHGELAEWIRRCLYFGLWLEDKFGDDWDVKASEALKGNSKLDQLIELVRDLRANGLQVTLDNEPLEDAEIGEKLGGFFK
jgi:hypothetical protein